MEKVNINTDANKCAECMRCQLICSFTYTGSFNPEKSCIVINPPDEIRFTDKCKKDCILCTRHCEFGAITRLEGG
jgi:ferredoxin